MRLKLIACEIFYRELCAAAARSMNQIDIEFITKGLHDIGQVGMSGQLSNILAEVDESKYEAVLLGYALCSNGIVGLRTVFSCCHPAHMSPQVLMMGSSKSSCQRMVDKEGQV